MTFRSERNPDSDNKAVLGVAMHLLFMFVLTLASNTHAQVAPRNPSSPDKIAAKDGVVWGALVYASNNAPDKKSEDPRDFPHLSTQLGKVFPFKNFDILGQSNQVIFREYESWVVPSKNLFLKLDSKGVAKGGGINLNLQFWQAQQVLIKTELVLRPNSPLFIGGPKWHDGRLIFVLVLKQTEPAAVRNKVTK